MLALLSCSLAWVLQIDFLEHAAVDDVIIMSVVLEEVRHRNASVYQRLRTLVESPSKRFFVFVNEHHRRAAVLSHADSPPQMAQTAGAARSRSACFRLQMNSSFGCLPWLQCMLCYREMYIEANVNEGPDDRHDKAI